MISNLLSGFIGAIIGGWIAGYYIKWQTRESAKHDLRSVVIRMGAHIQHGKGVTIEGPIGREHHTTDPWFDYMDQAIAAYHRYRALCFCSRRKRLDDAWTAFQGTKPFGETPFAHAPMIPGSNNISRITRFLAALD